MSQAFTSKKPSSLPPSAIGTCCPKKKRSPRSPLQDLNRISSSSNSSYASSSNVSIEAQKGCLRFLSSSSFKTPVHHRPKNLAKTPNSVPDALAFKQSKSKSSKENLSKGNLGLQTKRVTSDKVPRTVRKNPPCYQWHSGKKSGSRPNQKSKPCSDLNAHGKLLPRLPSACEELKPRECRLEGINDIADKHSQLKSCHSDANKTPLSKKVARSDLDSTVYGDVEENLNTSISRTPPIHNSVSPEIQCGSSLVSITTPACYGAGYVVSGVTDKRKCRPRGILTVEENYSGFDKMDVSSFDDDEKKITGVNNNVSPSLLPSPTEALVHWISSPHKGKKVLSWKPENVPNQCQRLAESTTLGSSTSPSSSSKTFWNISDSRDLSGAANDLRRKMSSSISPCGLSECQLPFDSILSPSCPSILCSPSSMPSCRPGSSEKEKGDHHNLKDQNSPFSLNSLGSGNVIQTPQSDSSSDLHIGLSLVHADPNRKDDNFNPDLNSLSEVLLSENFFLDSPVPPEDSVNSSFKFDCLTVPYESIDLSKLPKNLDDQDPWLSSSTIENASQSQMKISWREGLMSQYELDEVDCCRCLSDEEDLANDCGNSRLSDPQVNVEVDGNKKLNSDVGIAETEDNDKETFPALISCSGAESISTDGGGLVASMDGSDWTL